MFSKKKFLFVGLIVLTVVSSLAFAASEKSYTGEEVLEMSVQLVEKIEASGREIPKETEIAGDIISIEDSLYLMVKFMALYGESGEQGGVIPDQVDFLDINVPKKFKGRRAVEGRLDWPNIYKAGKDATALLEKSPVFFEKIKVLVTNGGSKTEETISADVLLYNFARALRWVYNNDFMPNYSMILDVVPPKF
jgi:hypothetical protein